MGCGVTNVRVVEPSAPFRSWEAFPIIRNNGMIGNDELCWRISCVRNLPNGLPPNVAENVLQFLEAVQGRVLVRASLQRVQPTQTLRCPEFLHTHIWYKRIKGVISCAVELKI